MGATGQTLLVLLALVLFMTLSVAIHKMNTNTREDTYSNKLSYDAITLAQSILDEAWAKNFDEKMDKNNFTTENNFGTDGSESYPYFDDLDDFIEYPAQDTINQHTYDIEITANYVDSNGDISSSRTSFKKLTVNIKDLDYRIDIKVDQIYSYLE